MDVFVEFKLCFHNFGEAGTVKTLIPNLIIFIFYIFMNSLVRYSTFFARKNEVIKGDGGDVTFDVSGGGAAFIFCSNLSTFWLHA